MSKKIYEVRGTITIEVLKRVKANDEYEAMELAEEHFKGLDEYCGNGGHDKLIGVYESSESVQLCGDYIEWQEAYETDNDDYDTDTDKGCTYKCTLCGEEFYCESDNSFDEYVEEEVWGHIQMTHEEEFEECQDWDTPTMIEEYYEREDD